MLEFRPSVPFRGAYCLSLSFAVGAAGFVCSSRGTTVAFAGEPLASESCPSRDSLEAAVRSLLGKAPLSAEDLNQIDVVDLGDRYVVTVKERVREYTDETRDCAKRARVAAVFAALTLAPPEIGTAEGTPPASNEGPEPEAAPSALPPAPPAPPPAPPPKPAVPPPRPARLSRAWTPGMEFGARAAVAPRSDKSPVDLGGQAQFILTSSHFGVMLGASIPASSTLEIQQTRIQQNRYSGVLGARLGWHTEQLRASFDFCALTAVVRLQRLDSSSVSTATRMEAGLHWGTTLTLSGGFLSPYLGGYAELVPFTIPIAVEPNGIIGRTSAVWLGLAAGLAVGTN